MAIMAAARSARRYARIGGALRGATAGPSSVGRVGQRIDGETGEEPTVKVRRDVPYRTAQFRRPFQCAWKGRRSESTNTGSVKSFST